MSADSGSRERGSKRVDAIARQRHGLDRVLREAERYLALNRRIATALPASAGGEIGVACVEGECLVIAAATPARATQARLAANEILEASRRYWPTPLARTRVVVTPGFRLGE